jgi:hypothetical protein
LICGLVPHPVDKGTCILPYANDTIVLFKDSFDMAIDVKNSSLSIWKYGCLKNKLCYEWDYANFRGQWKIGKLVWYFGVLIYEILGGSICGSILRIKDLNFTQEISVQKLYGWQGRSMSLVRRKVQINASLNIICIYYMSWFRFHNTCNEKLLKI